jgi:acyl carrier protein
MDKEQILKEIEYIFRRELDDENLSINTESSPGSVEKWDSITNLVLISGIEEKFNLTFSVDAIFSMNTVGDLVDYIYTNSRG